ncbi:MAG: transporter substrate-binding domain-containing protein, partial [Gammaproteobacteria bacterium]|nr:transporter substrate-binding domain-containing protein [Gammaproteobacteria bacterium]
MERQPKAHNLILFVFLLTVVVRFVESEPAPTLLEEIQVTGRLDVAMIGEPSQTGERPRGMRGFEHDLIELLADELGVEPHVVMVRNPGTGMAFEMVHRGEASLAAGGLSPDDRVAYSFRFSPPYFEFTPQLVYLKGNGPPGSLENIDITAVAVGSYPAYSRDLGKLQADDPQLDRRTFDNIAVLEQVWRGNARYAVAGSHDVLYGHRFFPGLRVAFELSDPFPLAWAFPRTIDDSIFRAASEFLENASVDGGMQILMDRRFGHVKGFGDASSLTFLHRIDQRLPSSEDLISAPRFSCKGLAKNLGNSIGSKPTAAILPSSLWRRLGFCEDTS